MAEPENGNTAADFEPVDHGHEALIAVQENEIESLRGQLDEARQKSLRAQADLDNYQKRVRKDLDEERRFAQLPLVRDLLPVLDNLGRAISAAESQPDAAGLLDGVRLVAKQLETVLARHHCTQIDALHEPFDPHRHQAVMQQPSAEHPEHTIVQVLQPGYQLHDRVIRPAQVIVSAPPAEPEAG
jgi:molecular chaperone GrpE